MNDGLENTTPTELCSTDEMNSETFINDEEFFKSSNGNNSTTTPPHQIFNSDDDSFSSSNSTSSPNLIIDQQDASSKGGYDSDYGGNNQNNNNNILQKKSFKIIDNNEKNGGSSSSSSSSSNPLKRKLIICENGIKSEHNKRIHLDYDYDPPSTMMTITTATTTATTTSSSSTVQLKRNNSSDDIISNYDNSIKKLDNNNEFWKKRMQLINFHQMFKDNDGIDLRQDTIDDDDVAPAIADNNDVNNIQTTTTTTTTSTTLSSSATAITTKNLIISGDQKEGHFQEYAQYLGLKPNVKYKCFKCFNSSYENLSELRDHQKICLFKDNHKIQQNLNDAVQQRSQQQQQQHSSTLSSSSSSSTITTLTQSLLPPSTSSSTSTTIYNSNNNNSNKFLINSQQLIQNTNLITNNNSTTIGIQQSTSSTTINDKQNNNNNNNKIKRKVFLCSACGTYYENWNLFLHMREVHKRHICLYCVGMFPSAERLTVHLEMKHDLEQNHFDCQEKLLRSSRESCYLMCCICEHLFTEHEDFSDHACQELIKPCSLCGEKGRHNSNCKASKTKSSSQIIRLQKKERLKKKTIINNSNSNNKIQLTNKKLINLDEKPLNLSNNFIHHNKTIINDKHNELNDNLNPSSLSSSQILHSKLNGCNTTLENNDNNKLFNDNNFIRKSITDEYNLKLPTSLLSLNNDDRNYQKTSKILDNRLGNYITNNSNENLSQTANETSSSIRNIFNTSDNNNILDFSMQTPTATATNHNISDNYYSNNNDFHHPHQHHQSPLPLPPPSSPYLNDNPTILDNNNPPTTTIEQPEEKPPILLVPKFKIKIPKEYQTPIDSEQTSSSSSSATESGSDEDELDKSLPIESDSDNAAGGAGAVASGGGVDDEIDVSKETIEEETKINIPINNDIETTNMANVDDDDENINKSDVTENCDENEKDKTTTTATIEKKQESSSDGDGDAAAGDGIEIANDDVQLIELSLNMPLDKISMIDFLRICLRRTYPICLYCNHARRIAVNGHSLALHFIGQHRFSATVDSITAEELQPSTILMKIKSFLPNLNQHYFNLATYNNNYALDQQHEQQEEQQYLNRNEKIFECFQCRFETSIHKELYLHNRKMHLKTAILCFMCRSNFFNYSEILCHICPGMANKCALFDIEFRCCLCSIDKIPSAFRLMVHLRKKHYACDVCLEDCHDQSRLSSHVWKHKLHHLCYRCGIAYRNKPDITKHLFWKHGTESILCKRCLQKRWPHVYHFCIPPPTFLCEICNLTFSKAMSLKVHKRLHTGDAPYHCIEDNCDKKFISRKLLLKHVSRHTTEDIEMKNTIIKEEDDEKKINLKENVDIIKKLKEENLNVDNEKQEKIDENIEVIPKEIGPTKKKRKKSKKDTKENLDDIMNMPAPNLSESDSSDDSAENEKTKLEIFSPTTLPNIMLSPASDNGNDKDDNEEILNTGKIMDIWENFKTFQATQPKVIDDDLDDIDILSLPPPILHVIQSDHDYCMMYKPLTTKLTKISSSDDTKIDDDNILLENKDEIKKPEEVQKSPKKKQKTSKKTDGKTGGSDSSSSGSSSSSDSTCSCGSNCSCSSSSGGSSSDSSSSSDTDSSTSEGKRRIAAKRAAKRAEKRNNKNKLNDTNSPKTNLSDIVDVVTTDTKPQDINPDTIILESDLETDESETDEDFYDEHPQKLANQLLAEKRKQLMIQTSLSPSHNYDIVENSRPSTPSLPEEMIKEKKVKIKKKKRDRKTPKHNSFKLNIPNLLNSTNQTLTALAQLTEPMIFSQPEIPIIQQVQQQAPIILSNEEIPMKISTPPIKTIINMSAIPPQQQIIPAPITNKNRLSTGSSSDADASLKRSKRRRRPNKFYGYSSDDDMTGTTQLTGPAAFKPTPPPNLTWRKEDLPTPPRNSSSQKTNRSSLASTSSSSLSSGRTKLSQLSTPPLLPPIPPIIIRPNLIGKKVQTPQQQQQQHDRIFQKPPIMDVMRVPPVPPHHIQPTSQQYIFNRESMESESSDDDRLHISTVPSRILQSPIMQQPIQQTPPSLPFSSSSSSTPIVPIIPVHQPTPPHPVKQQRIPPALLPNPDLARLQYFQRNHIRYPIRPPAGARPPREGESVYCYCRCPYDEVSEMIACDGDDCVIEWFHFECVGIMVPPKGKWFCPECRPNYPNEQYDNT